MECIGHRRKAEMMHGARVCTLCLAAACACALSATAVLAAPCAAPDTLTRVSGGDECLIIRTWRGSGAASPRTLYVLLHGNHSSGSPATSQFAVAAALAAQGGANAVAVALIRPGYNDADGNHSSGNSAGRGDNFTALNIDIVAAALATLKAFHRADRLVLVGHSGGAAMAGVTLGRHPGLADAAVLVGCPCDVPAWRAGRGRRDLWLSESASHYVDRIPLQSRIAVIVGRKDEVTAPSLSERYVADLRLRGIAATLTLIDEGDHNNVIAAPAVLAEALRLGRGD